MESIKVLYSAESESGSSEWDEAYPSRSKRIWKAVRAGLALCGGGAYSRRVRGEWACCVVVGWQEERAGREHGCGLRVSERRSPIEFQFIIARIRPDLEPITGSSRIHTCLIRKYRLASSKVSGPGSRLLPLAFASVGAHVCRVCTVLSPLSRNVFKNQRLDDYLQVKITPTLSEPLTLGIVSCATFSACVQFRI